MKRSNPKITGEQGQDKSGVCSPRKRIGASKCVLEKEKKLYSVLTTHDFWMCEDIQSGGRADRRYSSSGPEFPNVWTRGGR